MIPTEQDRLYRSFIENLGFEVVGFMGDPDDYSTFVYKSKEKEKKRVIKIAAEGKDRDLQWQFRHVVNENEILDRATNIPNIVRKCSYHTGQQGGYTIAAVVREFIYGRLLRDFPKVKRKLNSEQQMALENMIRTLHQEGMALFDIHARNIVVDRNDTPYLIDVGTALRRDKISKGYFASRVRRDLIDLDALFEKYC